MAAAPVAPERQKRPRGPPTPQRQQAPAPVGYVPGVEDLQRTMAVIPLVAVYSKRPRRDQEPASNQAVSAVTPPAASSTALRTICKNHESQPAAVAQPHHRAVTLGPATLAAPRQDLADSLAPQSRPVPTAVSSTIPKPLWARYQPGQQFAPQSAPPPPAPAVAASPPTSSRLTYTTTGPALPTAERPINQSINQSRQIREP